MKSTLRAAKKLPPLLAHVAYGVALSALVAVDRDRRWKREQLAVRWHKRLLRILHIDVEINGKPAAGARILVSNHVSWMDIPVLAATEPTRFVSKAEVHGWPIAGWLADASGTFYLKRGAGGTKRLIEDLREFVLGGGLFVFFPEGTTTDGRSLLRFQPRLFAVALESGCPVQPIALRYQPTVDGRDIAPFIGDDDLLSHLFRVLREPGLKVELCYSEAIDPVGRNRGQLAEATQAAIQALIAPASRGADRDRALAA